MASKLETYRNTADRLPESYLAWDLYGAGLDHFGRDGAPVEHPLRPPADDEVLLRVDAIGLCFSDTKLIWAGSEHPRIRGRDLAADPTVPGHEAAMTVAAVGADRRDRFSIGERYAIQADIHVNGEQKAFGYVQRGALAQYVYAGPWVLDGDAGCYLLPLRETTGYSEAALVEPWTCVEAAYSIPGRDGPLAGGALLLVSAGGSGEADMQGCYGAGAPRVAVALGGAARTGGPSGATLLDAGAATPEAVGACVDQHAGGDGFDDIVLLGAPDAALVEACDRALAQDGTLCLIGTPPASTAIDIGRVHYRGTRHVGGPAGTPVCEAYAANTRTELRAGGRCWIIGAAGPMGQMHVQRALELGEPPSVVLCTDVSAERLAYMDARLRPIAERRGVDLRILNPADSDDPDRILRDAAPEGFDDIAVMAPVAKLVEHAAGFLAKDAVMNIFAGVPLGTMAALPLATITEHHARYIGSSGSALADMLRTLEKTEQGALSTNYSLAALGDIRQGWEGVKAVKEGAFPGKIVLYPHLPGLGLATPGDLATICPAAHAAMEGDGLWTNAAEAALFEAKLP